MTATNGCFYVTLQFLFSHFCSLVKVVSLISDMVDLLDVIYSHQDEMPLLVDYDKEVPVKVCPLVVPHEVSGMVLSVEGELF